MTGTWLVTWNDTPAPASVLLALPQAGAGCGQYRPWQDALGPDVRVVGVQLPGRENRWAEPEPRDVPAVVDAVCAEFLDLVAPDVPFTVFGNSFGGLLGYEITRRLVHDHGRRPSAFVVAACRAPARWVGAGRGLVADDRALAALLDDRGLGDDDLDEESRELALEVLRRDARLSASYTHTGSPLLPCPVEAWGGRRDTTVTADQLTEWRDHAGAGFTLRIFPGGHYFCLEQDALVHARLRELTAPPALRVPAARRPPDHPDQR